MPLETALLLLQQLKGPALSCLIALAIASHPVTVRWLKSATGYGPHTVAHALTRLQDLGLAACNDRRSFWHLAALLRQPPPSDHRLLYRVRGGKCTSALQATRHNHGISAAADPILPAGPPPQIKPQ